MFLFAKGSIVFTVFVKIIRLISRMHNMWFQVPSLATKNKK